MNLFRTCLSRNETSSKTVFRAFSVLMALLVGNAMRAQSDYATPYTFTTLVGSPGNAGFVYGTGLSVRLASPKGVAVDSAGNLYVIDGGSESICKVTPAGVTKHFAGVPVSLQPPTVGPEIAPVDGGPNTAQFSLLQGIAIDSSGTLYVTDNKFIRQISTAGVVTTISGGASSPFVNPTGIAADNQGNLIVTDSSSDVIYRVSIATGVASTYAGFATQFGSADGTGTAARFSTPDAVAVDSGGNAYIADSGGTKVRMITPAGVVTTLAGSSSSIGSADGTGSAAQFVAENGIAVDAAGNVYVTEANNTVRKVTQAGVVTTLAGTPNVSGSSNGSGAAALFNGPFGIAVDSAGDMFITDIDNDTVRERYAAANAAPTVTLQPVSQSAPLGAFVTLSVTATGVPVPNYQWLFDGAYVTGLSTNPNFFILNVQPSNLGLYSCIITSPSGTVTSNSATLSSPGVTPVAPSSSSASEFANISTRALVQGGPDTEILGFVIAGPAGSTEQLLVRADGPSLAQFSVGGELLNPVLTLFDASGAQIATNTDWSSSPNASQIAAAASSAGAFALIPGNAGLSADSALLLNLPPGAYTAQVTSLDGSSGIALAEVYQAGAGSATLTNVSTRAYVSTGTSAEIAGLVIQGPQPTQVLIRAVGPTLAQFSVTGVLTKPTLSVVDASGNTIATNTGWSTNANAAAIATETAAVQTFPLPQGSADCALLLTLAPGTYTAIVTGVGGTSGIALVEAYQAP